MKKKIGIVGLDKKLKIFLEKRFKKLEFLKIQDSNLFSNKSLEINALVVLYEYPLKKKLSYFLTKVFSSFKKLEWLHLSRAGVDECEPYLSKYKFKFSAGKKIQAPNVSEHCLSLLLSLTRGLFDQLNSKKYTLRPTEIKDKKVLVVGLGGIGEEIAKKLHYFGAEISSVARSKKRKFFIKKNFSLKSVQQELKKFDIIINSLPQTKDTINFFNKKIFNKMRNKVIFVSISRDKIINLKDLKFFLKKKKFYGIAIENTGSFKMKDQITYNKNQNLIISNHLGGITTNNSRRIKLVLDNINSFSTGKKIKNIVSKNFRY